MSRKSDEYHDGNRRTCSVGQGSRRTRIWHRYHFMWFFTSKLLFVTCWSEYSIRGGWKGYCFSSCWKFFKHCVSFTLITGRNFQGMCFALWLDPAKVPDVAEDVMQDAGHTLPLLLANRVRAQCCDRMGRRFDAIMKRMPQVTFLFSLILFIFLKFYSKNACFVRVSTVIVHLQTWFVVFLKEMGW